MAFKQRVSFSEPPKATFSLKDYSGGINNVSDIQPNQARNLLNMAFTDGTLMEKRFGVKPSDLSLSIVTAKIVSVAQFEPYVGPRKTIVFTLEAGTYKMYVNKTFVRNFSGLPRGTNFMNRYYIVDGVDIYLYDGTDCKILKNPPAGFTPLPSPATVGAWKSDATNVWYEPCALELADSYKGANLIPVKPKLIVSNNSRLYISGCVDDPNNVYISDLENGFYFPVTMPIQADPNGEVVTSLNIFHDVLIVGRNESIYALYGNTNRADTGNQFQFRFINSHTGVYSQDTCAIMHNYMVYLGGDGVVYRLMTPLTDVRQVTTSIHSVTIDFFNKPISLSKTDMVGAHAVFFNNEYYLKMGKFIFVFNYRKMAWTVYDQIPSNHIAVINNTIYFCGDNGIIYEFKNKDAALTIVPNRPWVDTDIWVGTNIYGQSIFDTNRPYSDTLSDGTNSSVRAISAFWSSKRFDLGDPTRYKHFREMFVVTNTWKDFLSDISVRFEIDFVDVDNILSVKDSIAVFGKAKFGDRFINKDIASSLPTQIGRRGRYISFTIANNKDNHPLKVHEVAGDYILRGRR